MQSIICKIWKHCFYRKIPGKEDLFKISRKETNLFGSCMKNYYEIYAFTGQKIEQIVTFEYVAIYPPKIFNAIALNLNISWHEWIM